MQVRFKALTYEEARTEHFEALKRKAERKMIYWKAMADRSRPNNLADPAHIKASEFGTEYTYYKDALEALAAQPKWISVEDNPPDGTKDVIACNMYGEMLIGHVLAMSNGKEYYCETLQDNIYCVSHWMPLPEPPKEEV